jgi:hypothetical protein
MSTQRHAVVCGPSFTLFGYRPDFTPAHQVLLETGYTARICGRRTKPVVGKEVTFCIALSPSGVKQGDFSSSMLWILGSRRT